MNDAEANKIIARLEEIGATGSAQRILDQDAEIARLTADNERLRALIIGLETHIEAQRDRLTLLKADNERLRAALKNIRELNFTSDGWAHSDLIEQEIVFAIAHPAAPEERRTGLRLVMVAATLLDQEDLPDEPSAILCGSIDAIRSLGGLLGDPVDVLPAQPAAPGGDA